MKRIVFSALALLALCGSAFAQIPGNAPAGTVYGNSSAGGRPGRFETMTAILDRAIGSTNGQIAIRGASVWAGGGIASLLTAGTGIGISGTNNATIALAPAATNTVLGNATSGSAIPTALAVGSCSTASSALSWTTNTGFGCNTSIAATNVGITNDTTTNATMFPVWVTANTGNLPAKVTSTKLSFNPSTGSLTSTNFAGTLNGATFSVTNGVTYTFPSVTATMASLTVAAQTLSGGANVTSGNLGTISSGTTTINCGTVPLQYATNGGAFTLAAPANDGSCIVMLTNNGSAGAVTFSGFTVGATVGDTLTTTNTSKFSIHIWRVNSVSGYRVAAHQ